MRGLRFFLLTFFLAAWITIPSALIAQDQGELNPEQEQENVLPPDSVAPTESAQPAENVLEQANTWLRRILFRGELNSSYVGAYAQYQITSWREGIGSYGPVLAQMTVYSLGSTEYLGQDAEWLQAVYRTMDGEPTVIEYDLTVPPTAKVEKVYRALCRVDHGETRAVSLALPENQTDYDVADQATQMGEEEVRLYSGTYRTRVMRGSGFHGAPVVIYKSDDLPPLGIVVMGYGEQGMTYIGGGRDGTPVFPVPPPPRGR